MSLRSMNWAGDFSLKLGAYAQAEEMGMARKRTTRASGR